MAKKKEKQIFQVKDKGLIYIPFHELTDGFEEDNSTNYFHLNRKKTYSNISEDIVNMIQQELGNITSANTQKHGEAYIFAGFYY